MHRFLRLSVFFLFFSALFLPTEAGLSFCSGISLQTSSRTLIIPFSENKTKVFARLQKAGLRVTPDQTYTGTFAVNEPTTTAKLSAAYLEFSATGKISGIENIIPTETMGDAKNLIYKLAEQYRKEIGKNGTVQHNSSGTQYKIFASCGKTEIQTTLAVSYDSPKQQYYVSVKTIL